MLKLNPRPARGSLQALVAVLPASLLLLAVLCFSGLPARAEGGETRTDPKTGISMTLPSGWVFNENKSDHVFYVQRGDNPDICGFMDCLPPLEAPRTQTAREHAESMLASMKLFFPNYQYSGVTDTTMAGLPAAGFTQTDSTQTMFEVVAIAGGRRLELNFGAPNDQLASVRGEFDRIQSSVTIK